MTAFAIDLKFALFPVCKIVYLPVKLVSVRLISRRNLPKNIDKKVDCRNYKIVSGMR